MPVRPRRTGLWMCNSGNFTVQETWPPRGCAGPRAKLSYEVIIGEAAFYNILHFCILYHPALKADFQSSHEAPRSSLRVMHEHFHPITMLNSSF